MWYLIDVKKLDKPTSKKLWAIPEAQLYQYPTLDNLTYNLGTHEKPDVIPEGYTLKFLPSNADVATAQGRRLALLTTDPVNFRNPPWADPNNDDRSVSELSTISFFARVYQPLLTKEGLINFYPSFTQMYEDRPQVVSIGRFLQTAWKQLDESFDGWMTDCHGELTDERIRLFTEIPKALTPDDVKFARTPDEIELVYRNGPQSCMSHDTGRYSTRGFHPVRVYGAGDLAVAYLPKRRDPNSYSQRALCWPEKKIYSRIYGTGPLEGFLKSLGFTSGTFHGAKLLKIPVDGVNNHFVLPYVDYHDYVVERRDHLQIYHKKAPHRYAPTFTSATAPPATQRNVWPAGCSTSGAVEGLRKCTGCQGRLTMDRHRNGYTTCEKCERNFRRCYNCGVSHPHKEYNWIWIVSTDNLLEFSSWRDLRDNAMHYCQDVHCQAFVTRHVDSGNYHKLVKPERKANEARHTDQNAPVQTPDGLTDGTAL